MKNILKLLALLAITTPLAPISLNVVTHTSKDVSQAETKLTALGIKNSNFYALSNTSGILQQDGSEVAYFFDATKVNEASKGLTNLGIRFNFLSLLLPGVIRISDTTSILIDDDTNSAYFFDATKVNEASKGLVNLNQSIKSFNRLNETTGILATMSDQLFLFDATKVNEASKGLTYITTLFSNIFRLTDTTAIFSHQYSETYFFDATKVNEASKGLIKLTNINQMAKFYRLSDTTGIFVARSEGHGYFFDANKINESSQGIVDLGIEMNTSLLAFDNFISLTDTTALLKIDIKIGTTKEHDHLVYFDAAKINEASKGLVDLEIKVTDLVSFSKLSATKVVVKEQTSGSAYLFDANKVNDEGQWFTDLGTSMIMFRRLSDTTGVLLNGVNHGYFFDVTKVNESSKGLIDLGNNFDEAVFLYNEPLSATSLILSVKHNGQMYLFDANKINDASKGLIELGQQSEVLKKSFTRLSDITGILTNENRESYYFEYK